jgi:hypothetical protein
MGASSGPGRQVGKTEVWLPENRGDYWRITGNPEVAPKTSHFRLGDHPNHNREHTIGLRLAYNENQIISAENKSPQECAQCVV